MALSQGIGEARDIGGGTALERANQFVRISTAGVRDLVKRLEELANKATTPAILRKAVRTASKPLFDDYKNRAQSREATGNLAASVTRKYVDYPDGVVCIVGPRQTGPVGSTDTARSGNHAFLVEFGTSARKPGTQGRRIYINVHQRINGKMSRSGSFNNDQFEQMGRGYYFLMGSKYEPSRQGGGKAGYSKDFMLGKDGRSGEQHPITLHPGETIAAMPKLELMQKAIAATDRQVFAILKKTLEAEITSRGG